MNTYWYLASPYSRYPSGHEAAFKLACENAAILLQANIPTFSPIAHSHPLVEHGGLKAVDHDFWINTVDRPLMRGAHGLIFLKADGWVNSQGMHEEIVQFTEEGKPVVFMEPGKVPERFLPKANPFSPSPSMPPHALQRALQNVGMRNALNAW